MSRLILVNGAPAAGKSTLARLWAARHPLALVLDIDVIRGLLGGQLEDPEGAGRAARRLVVAMIDAHLATDRDVIVPQYLGRLDFVLELEGAARRAGGTFIEVLLVSDAAEVARRFAGRPAVGHDHDNAVLLERAGGPEALADAVSRAEAVADQRPRTRRVRVIPGDVVRTSADLAAAIESAGDAVGYWAG